MKILPVGLCGEFIIMALVRGVIERYRRSRSRYQLSAYVFRKGSIRDRI